MPLYCYDCRKCGELEKLVPLKDYKQDQFCPSCGAKLIRKLVSFYMSTSHTSTYKSHQINERSRHEPKKHNSLTCTNNENTASSKPLKMKMPKGSGSSRPWMISH